MTERRENRPRPRKADAQGTVEAGGKRRRDSRRNNSRPRPQRPMEVY